MSTESESGVSGSAVDAAKVDSAIAQITGGNQDLSQDPAPAVAPAADNIALQEMVHRTGIQKLIVKCAMGLVATLYLAGIVFACFILRVYYLNPKLIIDWHTSALAGAFVVPPTLIAIALVRAVYKDGGDKKEEESLPALNLIKEIALAVKEAAKAVK
ncbi:hypothetical protein [Burkholderia gladioli]|nr:hypothetical protein [Burkholderia gladioli]MBJ9675224.1 hypothetical protein [Burkholderia gladioli]MDN7463476.1 hypothetical protein [Burkholderia gladioli]